MTKRLTVSIGQASDRGRKEINQDFHGACIPTEPQLSAKGIAIALADGISSSSVSQQASETAIKSFLQDYYCTSEAWTVKKSAQRVLLATNSWLHSQTRRSQYCYDRDKGYVCTFSAMVIKSATAHIFHVGDSRIYRLQDNTLEQLTEDHRLWISRHESYLNRALGVTPQLEIDYQAIPLTQGDTFVLASDGIYEHAHPRFIAQTIKTQGDDLDQAARTILDEALAQGSEDNLTIQIVRIDALPTPDARELYQSLTELPFPPQLEARAEIDGYRIIRDLHVSSRSHVYLAVDEESGRQVVIKTPSVDLRDDAGYLERFLMEEWIANRINSPHVLKPCAQTRKRNYLYIVTEFIEGQTLSQWMIDNPNPDLETVRDIIEQIAKGLRAFHRLEMLHQDLRPANIMIDQGGTVKIIDFGSTRVAGIVEIARPEDEPQILGTAAYTAPEYFIGDRATSRSDQFSLALIAYQMLSGRLPYGTEVAKAKSRAALRKLRYQPLVDEKSEIPAWIDEAIRKACHPDPHKRYEEISEFIYDLRHPNKAFLDKSRPPLMERNPVIFWKTTSLILALIIIVLIVTHPALQGQ